MLVVNDTFMPPAGLNSGVPNWIGKNEAITCSVVKRAASPFQSSCLDVYIEASLAYGSPERDTCAAGPHGVQGCQLLSRASGFFDCETLLCHDRRGLCELTQEID
eukprot:6079416-Pyramimonas_sp.AAC.1